MTHQYSQFTFCTVLLIFAITGCTESASSRSNLAAQSAVAYSISESQSQLIPMTGYVEFEERVEVAAVTNTKSCFFATYEFRFDYDTSIFVEFRDGLPGFCSYGAVLTKSFGVQVLTESDFPVGTQLEPFIQFQQSNSHNGIIQIGSEYFLERVGDLQTVEILCRRDSCDGSVERRDATPRSAAVPTS